MTDPRAYQKNLLLIAIFFLMTAAIHPVAPAQPPKVVIIMIDGLGIDYYRSLALPHLNRLERDGGFRQVMSLMPTVTNLNNASIATGCFPDQHGIIGNSYFDRREKQEYFMENDSLLMANTIFTIAGRSGVKSALFSSKRKTIDLLSKGVERKLSPEMADSSWKARLGEPPSIYSREVNYWLLDAALYSMEHDKDIGLFYIHTTDYPMHTWAPEQTESMDHLRRLDEYIGRIISLLPEAIIVVTADHSVHHKSVCWDLKKALSSRGLSIVEAISPERDKYVRHHRGFGGTSYVYLSGPKDSQAVRKALLGLDGIEDVLTREQAALRFHLMPERIGDLVVLGDARTVFGDLDSERENLPEGYRSHGSLHEVDVPLFVRNSAFEKSGKGMGYNFQMTEKLISLLTRH